MSDEEKIQTAALGLLGLFGLAKRSGDAERQEAERQAKLEAERQEAERREAERREAERENETFTFRNYLVKFWNMFDTVDKDRNGKLSKNELRTYLRANEQLKSDLGASVEGESARARLFQAMDENRDGTFSRMEFAVYCAHKLFGTDPIEDEVAIRQFYYSNDPDTGGWDDITQYLIDRYRLQYDDNSDDELEIPDTIPLPPSPIETEDRPAKTMNDPKVDLDANLTVVEDVRKILRNTNIENYTKFIWDDRRRKKIGTYMRWKGLSGAKTNTAKKFEHYAPVANNLKELKDLYATHMRGQGGADVILDWEDMVDRYAAAFLKDPAKMKEYVKKYAKRYFGYDVSDSDYRNISIQDRKGMAFLYGMPESIKYAEKEIQEDADLFGLNLKPTMKLRF